MRRGKCECSPLPVRQMVLYRRCDHVIAVSELSLATGHRFPRCSFGNSRNRVSQPGLKSTIFPHLALSNRVWGGTEMGTRDVQPWFRLACYFPSSLSTKAYGTHSRPPQKIRSFQIAVPFTICRPWPYFTVRPLSIVNWGMISTS